MKNKLLDCLAYTIVITMGLFLSGLVCWLMWPGILFVPPIIVFCVIMSWAMNRVFE